VFGSGRQSWAGPIWRQFMTDATKKAMKASTRGKAPVQRPASEGDRVVRPSSAVRRLAPTRRPPLLPTLDGTPQCLQPTHNQSLRRRGRPLTFESVPVFRPSRYAPVLFDWTCIPRAPVAPDLVTLSLWDWATPSSVTIQKKYLMRVPGSAAGSQPGCAHRPDCRTCPGAD